MIRISYRVMEIETNFVFTYIRQNFFYRIGPLTIKTDVCTRDLDQLNLAQDGDLI